jgi:hypothetical protein
MPEASDISTSGNYELVLISMDAPTGARRRAALNFQHQHRVVGLPGEEAPADFAARFRLLHTSGPRYRSATIGCAWSHQLALRLIVDLDLRDVVVLEDDARLVRPLPPPELLRSAGGPVYLGGSFTTPGPYVHHQRDFSPAIEDAVWEACVPGLNAVDYARFSIVGTEAIYYPDAAAARRVAAAVEAAPRLTYWDGFLRRHRLVGNFFFPNPFAAQDDEVSHVSCRVHLRDLYAHGQRKIAKRRARMAERAALAAG